MAKTRSRELYPGGPDGPRSEEWFDAYHKRIPHYIQGHCYDLAGYLHDRMGFPIWGAVDEDGFIGHAFAYNPRTRMALDARGLMDPDDMLDLDPTLVDVRPLTKEESRSLCDRWDSDERDFVHNFGKYIWDLGPSVSRIAARHKRGGIYKPMSEISPGTQDTLDSPTPEWLDRDYPYVSYPSEKSTSKELDYLVSLIPMRDQHRSFIEQADEAMESLFVTLCSELGAPCDEEALREMTSESAILITKLKWLYNRERPYQFAAEHGRTDFTVMDSVTAHTPAYPSGHTIQAYLIASRLSETSPQHRKAFMDLAHRISWSRAVAGYHWPSDLIFGKSIFRHIVMPHMPSSVRVASRATSYRAARVAAKYKGKREVPKADGKGTTTIYEYGPRQVAKRHKEKASRIESLRQKMADLRDKSRADLTSADPETRLTALAVCLMDETYERVGNEKSAKEGHHGVTNWNADHVTLSDKAATIRYTGKSGVKQEKKVTNARVLSALRKALKGKGKGDKILCDGEDCSVLAKDVNAYLKPFGITAKDIRGLHANEEMKHHLKAQRKAGPADLPRSRKEKDEILKAEFQAALDLAAAAVGHKPATLRGQYLVPSMEASYIHDGTVIDKLDKTAHRTASWMKVKRFFPDVRSPVFHATTGPRAASIALRGEGIKSNSGFSNFGAGNMGSISLSRDLNFLLKGGFGKVVFVLDRNELNRKFPVDPHAYPNWEDEYEERVFTDKIPASMIRGVILRYEPLGFELDEWESKVDYPVAYLDGRGWGARTATLSDADNEDREDERQVRQSPKKKPPRTDKERRMVKDNDNSEVDPDAKQDQKDRSQNYKDAAARVALRFFLAAEEGDDDSSGSGGGVGGMFLRFLEEEGDKKVTNPDTGNKVKLKSLRGPKGKEVQQKAFEDWKENQSDDSSGGSPGGSSGGSDDSSPAPSGSSPSSDASLDSIKNALGGSVPDELTKGDLSDEVMAEVARLVQAGKGEIASSLSSASGRETARKDAENMSDVLSRLDSDNPPSAQEIAKAVIAQRTKVLLDDPDMLNPAKPLSSYSTTRAEVSDPRKQRKEQAAQSIDAMDTYRKMSAEDRDTHRSKLETMLKEMKSMGQQESERFSAAQAQMRGLQLASMLEDGDDAKGSPIFQSMLKGAEARGELDKFVTLNITGAAEGNASAQSEFRKAIQSLPTEELQKVLPDEHPAQEVISGLLDPKVMSTMDAESRRILTSLLGDTVLGEVVFTDQTLVNNGGNAGEIRKRRRQAPPSRYSNSLMDFWSRLFGNSPSRRASVRLFAVEGYDFTEW